MTTDDSSKAGRQSQLSQIENIIQNPELRVRSIGKSLPNGAVRPRNASTLILLDNSGNTPKVLMGKRNKNLKFMPGALVFPGGSVDKHDGSIPSSDTLHPKTQCKLIENMSGRPTTRSARALAMAAIREMSEECGLLIGVKGELNTKHKGWEDFKQNNIVPKLSAIRLFARAITPPDLPRRFDTWFFITTVSEVGFIPEGGFMPDGELEELQWIEPEMAIEENTREITKMMLAELIRRLRDDPDLNEDYPAPFYRSQYGCFLRSTI